MDKVIKSKFEATIDLISIYDDDGKNKLDNLHVSWLSSCTKRTIYFKYYILSIFFN